MREIKFRAWHKGHKMNHRVTYEPKMLFDDKAGDCLRYVNEGQNISHVMQYTGRKDKNGTEIYEGDISKAYCMQAGLYPESVTAVVEYLDCNFALRHTNPKKHLNYWLGSPHVTSIEIIGNIHENPELLEADK